MVDLGSLISILKNTNLNFSSILIILILRCVIVQKTIFLHFIEENALTTDSITPKSYLYLDYVDDNYKKCNRNSNFKILQTFLIDMEEFIFEFLSEDEFNKNSDYELYISTNILTFSDFSYFYNIVLSFPCLIDNINEEKYLLILKIISIFKFESEKLVKDFIRFIWSSIIFNSISMKEWNFQSTGLKNGVFLNDTHLSKIVLIEIFKIFRVSKEVIYKINDIPWAQTIQKNYMFDFVTINDDFLYFDNHIIENFLTIDSRSSNFFVFLDTFFRIHIFKHYFLHHISYTDNLSRFFNLSLFKTIDEIYIAFSLNTDVLIEKIYQTSELKNIKILNILYSKFTINDEISFLKTYNFEKLNYIVSSSKERTFFRNSTIHSPVHNIYTKFIEEICENKKNIFSYKKRILGNIITNNLMLICYHDKSIKKKIENLNSLSSMFIYAKLYNKYFWLKFFVMNLEEVRNIDIRFTDMYIKDFKVSSKELLQNIIRIIVVNSKLTDIFLSTILLLPSLREVFISDSEISFSNTQQPWKKNTTIQKFTILNSSMENQDLFIIFLNKMLSIIKMKYSCSEHTICSNIFISSFNETTINLTNLYSLKYYFSYLSCRLIPSFPMFAGLRKLNFGFGYPEGTLQQIFLNKNCNNLKKLKIYGVYISSKDKIALEKCTNLSYLSLSNTCQFSKLDFCELFDLTRDYQITELHLPNIELSDCDFIFFSKLKSLKELHFNGSKPKCNFYLILKSLRCIENLEIRRLILPNDHISMLNEEFGSRIKNLI